MQIINTNILANVINIEALSHFKDWMLKRRKNAIWDKESNNMFELNECMLNMFEMITFKYNIECPHYIEYNIDIQWKKISEVLFAVSCH